MQHIYCISGLAADHSLFKNIAVPGYKLVPLSWLPYDNSDDMGSYAAKMAAEIPDANPIIIGLSFGGMLATEMARQHPDWKVFIVSSAKTAYELGYNSSFLRWLSTSPLLPSSLFNMPNFFALFSFSAKSSEERTMLRNVIRASDPKLVKWSIKTLLHWGNKIVPANVIHIHGTNDKIINPRNVAAHHWINNGSHLMIYSRGAEVSKIITAALPVVKQ